MQTVQHFQVVQARKGRRVHGGEVVQRDQAPVRYATPPKSTHTHKIMLSTRRPDQRVRPWTTDFDHVHALEASETKEAVSR